MQSKETMAKSSGGISKVICTCTYKKHLEKQRCQKSSPFIDFIV